MVVVLFANDYSPRVLKDIVLREVYDKKKKMADVPIYKDVKEIESELDRGKYLDDPIDYIADPRTIQYRLNTQKEPFIGDCDDYSMYFSYAANRLQTVSDTKILLLQMLDDITNQGHSVAIYREDNKWWIYDYSIEGPFKDIRSIIKFVVDDKYAGSKKVFYIMYDIQYPSTNPVAYRYGIEDYS